MFPHGYTFGGHPVSCAVALANLDIFEREDLLGHVLRNENALRQTLERLYDLPIVGDIRGDGYFYGIELVKDKGTKEPSTRPTPNGSCAAMSPVRCTRTGSTVGPTIAATPSFRWPRR